MADRRLVPARQTRTELEINRSRFIATLAPATTIEAARDFVAAVRAEFSDATHNVPAYIVGHGGAVTAHCSDDGEPSGTAGRPALAVLQGSGLGDAAVVVTRYYGGIKLGTGGLVRAYGDAVRSVLQQTPLAAKVATVTLQLTLPYALFEQGKLLIADKGGVILDEQFAAAVTLQLRLQTADYEPFSAALTELTAGQVTPQILARENDTLMPL